MRYSASVFWVLLGALVGTVAVDGAAVLDKRSVVVEKTPQDYPEYQTGARYNDYPIIVPKKRTAILIDRLMVALKKAIEEESGNQNSIDGTTNMKTYTLRPEDAVRAMDLQRRGQQKGRAYWRCYFNAVTCF